MPARRETYLLLRVLLVSMNWLQFVVIGNPYTSLLLSYPKAYAEWIRHGNEGDWAGALLAVSLLGTLALFELGVFTRFVSGVAAFSQAVVFLAMALLFAETMPPQTGVAYFAPAMTAFYLSYKSYFRGV